jgi:hypothetical protein
MVDLGSVSTVLSSRTAKKRGAASQVRSARAVVLSAAVLVGTELVTIVRHVPSGIRE